MTILAIIIDVVIFFTILIIGLYISSGSDDFGRGIIITFAILIIIIIITVSTQLFYYNNTASGKRAIKTQKSELSNGLNRKINVYSMNGQLIKTYEGHFDVDYDENRIIFDDEKGNRHIIYYPTGTITIDELKKEEKQ